MKILELTKHNGTMIAINTKYIASVEAPDKYDGFNCGFKAIVRTIDNQSFTVKESYENIMHMLMTL